MTRRLNLVTVLPAIRRRLHNHRFWRDSGLLMLANVIAVGAGVIKTPATTWLLTKEEVGMIGVVTAWSAFLVFLSWPSSLHASTYHYVAKGYPSAFLVYLKQQSQASLLSVVGYLICAAYWGYWQGNPVLASLFVIGGVLYPFTDMLSASAGMLGAQEKFVELFWYRIGRTLSRFTGFIFLIASVWWFNPATTFYATNQTVMGAFQLGVVIWLVWQLRRMQVAPMPSEDRREMLRYGKHQTGVTVISVIQSRMDQLLVSVFMPLAVIADYSIGLLVYTQLKQIWQIYVGVRYPQLVRLPVQKRRWRIVAEGGILWLGILAFALILSLAAYWLIDILLPASYASSLGYIILLLATFVVGVPGFLAEVYFRTQQDERRQYILRGTAAILSVVLPTLLIMPLGAYGVVIGRFIGNIGLSLTGAWLFWNENVV